MPPAALRIERGHPRYARPLLAPTPPPEWLPSRSGPGPSDRGPQSLRSRRLLLALPPLAHVSGPDRMPLSRPIEIPRGLSPRDLVLESRLAIRKTTETACTAHRPPPPRRAKAAQAYLWSFP